VESEIRARGVADGLMSVHLHYAGRVHKDPGPTEPIFKTFKGYHLCMGRGPENRSPAFPKKCMVDFCFQHRFA
jgi:hypothetical protein